MPDYLRRAGQSFHLFPILMPNLGTRSSLLEHTKAREVLLAFHYVPLHSSPGGIRFGHSTSGFSDTNKVSDTLVRLPLFSDMSNDDAVCVIEAVATFRETI